MMMMMMITCRPHRDEDIGGMIAINVAERERAHNSWLGPPPITQRPLKDRGKGKPFPLEEHTPTSHLPPLLPSPCTLRPSG